MKLIAFLIIILLNISVLAQRFDDSQKYHFVEEHNIHRKIVGSPPVRWSDTLEIAAQKQVNLIVANPNSADIDNYYGVNLYRSVKEPTAADILANWVKQQKYYHGEEITEKNNKLKEKIFQFVGEEFNINSPKQLGVILFEKLKLPTSKKIKTGYSTDASVLEKLAQKHEAVRYILEYRKVPFY